MGWVTLTLRKMELKQAHAQYQLRDIQISREKRQLARRKSYNTNSRQTALQQELRDLRNTGYDDYLQTYNNGLQNLRDQYKQYKDGVPDGDKVLSYDEWETQTITNQADTMDGIKEEFENNKLLYDEEVNFLKTINEDELAMIEEEAADEELRLDMEQTEVEAQMEAISQEMQAVSEAISSQIQSSTIKLS